MKQILFSIVLLILTLIGGLVATSAAVKRTDISLGKDRSLSLLSQNIKWDPDGHISYVTFPNGSRTFFIPGNQSSYALTTSTPQSLEQALAHNASFNKIFGPDTNIPYRNYYATITSVLQTDPKNMYHLLAFTQYEQQAVRADGTNDYQNFTSSIGLLESYDGGKTWKDFGPIIKGDDYISPGLKVSGAGEPDAIINNGYVYVYFVDWAASVKVSHPDQIYLARSKIYPDGGLGAFEFYTPSGFVTDDSNLQPVIKAQSGIGEYASLPSISYNQYLGEFLAVYEGENGFYQATSSDGINWKNQKLFDSFIKPLSTRETGDVWFSYPTLLSDKNEPSDGLTSDTGNLYYGKGIWPNVAHQLTVMPYQFK